MFSERCLVQAPQGAKDWGAVAGGSGPGGLPAGREGPVAQSSPFPPLPSHACTRPSSFQPLNASTKPRERKTQGVQGRGWWVDGVDVVASAGEPASRTRQGQAVRGHLPPVAGLAPLLSVSLV